MQDFGLVVIGAHSGLYLKDLVSKYQDRNVLLVEPVPYNYEILNSEYKDNPKITICKNAIIDKSKKDFFYYVKKESISKLGKHWASQIGSFDKNHILNHKNKRFDIKEDDIETIQIEFITFDDLIKRYSIKSIDKLQIDVEGAEYKIMNSINFQKIEINKILFESKHFDGTFIEGKKLQEIEEKLKSNGYKLQQIDKENILASK
ncbi:FkbM family methyltransferase [Candidatus Pelagibacter sp.]|nr:FkbM family methyltransferase [Candidatus Pelagibacter sp.]